MKLLGNPRSPYVKKIVIALKEKGMEYDYLEVGAGDPAVGEANPLAKIPTLICDDGNALFDSPVIAEYVDGLDGAPKLIPSDFANRIAVKQWEALADGVTDAAVALSHEEREPVEKRKGPAFTAKQTKKIDAGLSVLNLTLGRSVFLHGGAFSLGDVACYCALTYLDRTQPNYDWRSAYPNLANFALRLAERPSVAQS
jgi:glutathione S-transferase